MSELETLEHTLAKRLGVGDQVQLANFSANLQCEDLSLYTFELKLAHCFKDKFAHSKKCIRTCLINSSYVKLVRLQFRVLQTAFQLQTTFLLRQGTDVSQTALDYAWQVKDLRASWRFLEGRNSAKAELIVFRGFGVSNFLRMCFIVVSAHSKPPTR